MNVKAFYVIDNYRNWVKPRDVVWEYKGDDLGIAQEDSWMHQMKFKAVTRNRDGSGPFFTVPAAVLDPLTIN